jgi:hypothetical protein
MEREIQLAEARAERERDEAAAAELIAAGVLDRVRIEPAARDMVLDRLGELLAMGQDDGEPLEWADTDLGFTLHARPAPGRSSVMHALDGDLTIDGLTLEVIAIDSTNFGRAPGAASGTDG